MPSKNILKTFCFVLYENVHSPKGLRISISSITRNLYNSSTLQPPKICLDKNLDKVSWWFYPWEERPTCWMVMGSGPIIWDGSFYSTIYYKKGKIKGNEGSFFLYQKVMKGKRTFFFLGFQKKKRGGGQQRRRRRSWME